MPRRPKSDSNIHTLAPRLRVIANGDDEVNGYRSYLSCVLASSKEVDLPATSTGNTLPRAQTLAPAPADAKRPAAKFKKQVKLAKRPAPKHAYVNVFVEFLRESMMYDTAAIDRVRKLIEDDRGQCGDVPCTTVNNQNLLSATVSVDLLPKLAAAPGIAFIHASEPLMLNVPEPSAAVAPPSRRVAEGAAVHKDGQNILIGIIDVGGFDFTHPDFLDASGNTRFHSIWDQGGTTRPGPAAYEYGSLITKAHMDQALAAQRGGGLPAHILEPQSQMGKSSHGTHVASIAAGKSGVCSKAVIAAVLIDIPSGESEIERRRFTFSDSSRIAHAVDYLLKTANELNRPVSINISLGTNGGGHDGANGISRWIDAKLASPGTAVAIAAGNAGQEKATAEGDLGWIMGRIHTSGQIRARDLDVDLEWVVVGDGIEDFSENELEIWYPSQDRFQISIQAPGQSNWHTVQPRQYIENLRLSDGTRLSVYSELYHPTNGNNYISVYLSPNLEESNMRGIGAGVWRVRLRGIEIRDGRFNAWIERDDPRDIGRRDGRRLMLFPSFFSAATNVDSHSISSLACGRWQISVGNLDEAKRKVNISSSQGPTRDSRYKPDVVAPGTDIAAANGFAAGGERWVAMTGTSMASPYVCGVLGLMLAVNPRLNSAQCAGILHRTSQPLPGADFQWRNDAGFGRIDPAAAIREAQGFDQRTDVTTGGDQ